MRHARHSSKGCWDLIAIVVAALGLLLAESGSIWLGAILYEPDVESLGGPASAGRL